MNNEYLINIIYSNNFFVDFYSPNMFLEYSRYTYIYLGMALTTNGVKVLSDRW